MLIVALTGGIACGKSVVARILKEKGCYVQSADLVARSLMSPGTPAWTEIVGHFGKSILGPDDTIDRARLGAIVFSDGRERAALNRIIHPRVLEIMKAAISDLERNRRTKIFILEAALIIEAGYLDMFDKIVVVSCSTETQALRLMARDGIGREEALRKIQSQMPQAEKLLRADYAIDTSGTVGETIDQTERIFAVLMRDYENKAKKLF